MTINDQNNYQQCHAICPTENCNGVCDRIQGHLINPPTQTHHCPVCGTLWGNPRKYAEDDIDTSGHNGNGNGMLVHA